MIRACAGVTPGSQEGNHSRLSTGGLREWYHSRCGWTGRRRTGAVGTDWVWTPGRSREGAGQVPACRVVARPVKRPRYSTVTVLARLRGWSTSLPSQTAISYARSCNGTTVTSGSTSGGTSAGTVST